MQKLIKIINAFLETFAISKLNRRNQGKYRILKIFFDA